MVVRRYGRTRIAARQTADKSALRRRIRPLLQLAGAAYRDRGAAAVEFALLAPLFFMLVFGMISAGLALSRQINLTQAAREASRYGSTLSFQAAGGGITGWLSQVAASVDQAAGPADSPTGGYQSDSCVAYVEPAGLVSHRLLDGSAGTGPCPGTTVDTALGSAYVQVVLHRDTTFNAILLSKTITLSSTSVTPYEAAR